VFKYELMCRDILLLIKVEDVSKDESETDYQAVAAEEEEDDDDAGGGDVGDDAGEKRTKRSRRRRHRAGEAGVSVSKTLITAADRPDCKVSETLNESIV